MAEGRMLKKEISDSKKLGRLSSDRPRVLYFMMLPHLDVKGRLYADPIKIKGQIVTMLPYSALSIQRALEAINEVGLIILYQLNGNQYLEYTRFGDFQRINTDREAESTIPPPTPERSGVIQRTPLKLSKDKLSLNKVNITVIFDKWNFYKGKKNWKSHRELSYEIEQAITEQLKHYSVDNICGAIDNYARVLLSPDFKWSYAWTLQQFLTRSRQGDRSEKQFWRFLPNNYHDKDYMKESVIRSKIVKERERNWEYEEYSDWILDRPESVIIKFWKDRPDLRWLVRKLRPEIATKAAKE